MSEEWRPIPGFAYEVSDAGRVRNQKGHVLRPCTQHRGYLQVSLFRRKPLRPSSVRVHRLVAAAFIPNPDNLPEVNHKDLDKTNNAASNLEWVNHVENHAHCLAMGKYDAVNFPERRRKLTPEQVLDLRTTYAAGGKSIIQCAKQFGIADSTAYRILSGERWPTVGAVIPKGLRKAAGDLSPVRREILRLLEIEPRNGADVCRALGRPDDCHIYTALFALAKEGKVTRTKIGRRVLYTPTSALQSQASTASADEGKTHE